MVNLSIYYVRLIAPLPYSDHFFHMQRIQHLFDTKRRTSGQNEACLQPLEFVRGIR